MVKFLSVVASAKTFMKVGIYRSDEVENKSTVG